MAFFQAVDWHEGERTMQQKLHVPPRDNPTVPMLSPQASAMLQRAPLLALGTLDEHKRPWTTVWGGTKGFAEPLGNSLMGVRAKVAAQHDPVIEALLGTNADGEPVHHRDGGRLVAGLTLDLETRKRVKLSGRVMGGALDAQVEDSTKGEALAQLVIRIDESLGNCPKYLNKRTITRANPRPRLISDSLPLPQRAIDLIHKSDLFFLSTTHSDSDMDTNIRGGPPGFVRVFTNDDGSVSLVYPEYSGNRFYQSLGNLLTNSMAGWCFPDFETGDCLYLTGNAEILVGREAAAVIAKTNLAVKFTVTAARFVEATLPFRGAAGEFSPYNPVVRYLTTEKADSGQRLTAESKNTAKLLDQTPLTPTISKFRFSLSNAATYTAGQFVTLDFSEHLDIGYSHMRDDDPRSLNDDFVRTFTVSSPPSQQPRPSIRLADDEFEITIRKVGVATEFLFKHGLPESRHKNRPELEVDVKGFGGSFSVRQDENAPIVGYVSAGVGITPLLPSLANLALAKVQLLWSMRWEDIGLARSILAEHPELARQTRMFLTGVARKSADEADDLKAIEVYGATVAYRRMVRSDVAAMRSMVNRWYVCTGRTQRTAVLEWLAGEEVLYEDYDF